MKRVSIIILIIFIAETINPFITAKATTIKNVTVLQDIGVPTEDFVGSVSLTEANLYESTFNTKYLFPMQGMCITDDGKIALIDNSYGRVHVLNSLLQNSYTFGSLSQLIYPTDIAYYSNNFYISDALGGGIKVFSKSGSYVKTFSQGIDTPTGVAVSKDGIFVSEYLVGKILKLDFKGNILKTVSINFPGGLSTNGNGTIIAVSMSENKIYMLDTNLNITKSFDGKELVFPSDMALDSKGNIYVVDRGLSRNADENGRVVVYNSSGVFVSSIGTTATSYPNQKDGSLLTPCGIAIDTFGSVYVMDGGYYYWNQESDAPFGFPIGARLSVFTSNGIFLSKKDFLHDTQGILVNPTGVTLDENGNMWVVNKGGFDSSELVEFSLSGKFVKTVKTMGSAPLSSAICIFSDKKGTLFVGMNNSIAVFTSTGTFKNSITNSSLGLVKKIIKGKDGNLYVTNEDLNTVVKLTTQGTVLKSFSVCGSPSGIAQSSNGNFFITSLADNTIYVYDSNLKLLRKIGQGSGRGLLQLYAPEDIAIDKYGNLIVCDTENGRLSFFSQDGALLYQTARSFYEIISIESEGSTFLAADCFHNVIRVISEGVEDQPYSFYISIYPASAVVSPGDYETFFLTIGNNGADPDDFTVSLINILPSGWSYKVDESTPYTFTIQPNASKIVKITVFTSKIAKDGDKGSLLINVTSTKSKIIKSINANITISTQLPLTIYSQDIFISNGASFSLPIFIKNANGIRGVSFDLSFNKNALSFVGIDLPVGATDNLLVFNETTTGVTIATAAPSGKSLEGKLQILNIKLKAKSISTNLINFSNLNAYNVLDETQIPESKPLSITIGPYLWLSFSTGTISSNQTFSFTGKTDIGCAVTVNGIPIQIKTDGSFSANVSLLYNTNTVAVVSKAKSGEQSTISRTVYYRGKIKITIVMQIGNPIMVVNGVKEEIDPGRGTVPIILTGWNRTIVPIRAIVETLGGTISYTDKDQLVTIVFKGKNIKLWINNPVAEVNGIKVKIDPDNSKVVPIIINSRTMLPVRFVGENLGCTVSWDEKTKKVTLFYSE
jgi:sugar lactone lactonase YvrE